MTWKLHITGRVQGVGFRPAVYRLARTLGLRGTVSNGADGVRIRFNAHAGLAEAFLRRLLEDLPPRALVTSSELRAVAQETYPSFRIIESDFGGQPDLLLSPDFAMCSDCRDELQDSRNRRFRYPFTTCTNCGPRYAITRALPYDRERTTMAAFEMCGACRQEYEDPDNRRHFSQTNSCPDCGIRLTFIDAGGARSRDTGLSKTVAALREGQIVAVKGVAGYLLCCDALSVSAVRELRRRKARPEKPFALLFKTLDQIRGYARVSDAAARELCDPAAPIVLLPKLSGSNPVFHPVAPLNDIGAMLPSNPLLELIARDFGGPLVATSANRSGAPICTDGQESDLAALAHCMLTHDLPVAQAQDDSLVRFAPNSHRRIVLRRGRGLAPALLPPANQATEMEALAAGADLKSSFAIATAGHTYVSPYLGDLSDFATHQRFRASLDRLLRISRGNPDRVLIDLHPGYVSAGLVREFAEQRGLPVYQIQHHEAHFAALLGEHDLFHQSDDLLGVVWDGTGLGHDGNIWGGEFFRVADGVFQRVAHLPYVPHVGGDNMAREPGYSALAYAGHLPAARPLLEAHFGTPRVDNLLLLRQRPTLHTSSVGRLFDAAAFFLGIADKQTYEGQAALQLEQLARKGFAANDNVDPFSLPSLFEELLAAREQQTKHLIAARFHLTLVHWIAEVAEAQRVTAIGLTGGVFQNALLVDLIEQHLSAYTLYFHEQLPPNDENIGYGQLIHHALGEKIKNRRHEVPRGQSRTANRQSICA